MIAQVANGVLRALRHAGRWLPGGAAPHQETPHPLEAPTETLPARTRAPRPLTEIEVVAQILLHRQDLENTFGPITQLGVEIRTHGRSRADVLILAADLIAIEAKLSDWKRAVGQAVLNTTVVDRSYVAMWGGYIPSGLLQAAEEYGIGVIAVHLDGLEIVVKAVSGRPDPTARTKILARLTESLTNQGFEAL